MGIEPFKRSFPVPVISARRIKYSTDENYRERAKDLSRNAYRKRARMETQSCLYSLKFLDKLASDYVVILRGRRVVVKGFSVPMASEALQQLYQTVWRWIQNGIIPNPTLVCVDHSGPKWSFPIYHVEEVRILIEEIGEHEKNMAYLRKDHVDVRGRIEQRILAFRKTLRQLTK